MVDIDLLCTYLEELSCMIFTGLTDCLDLAVVGGGHDLCPGCVVASLVRW